MDKINKPTGAGIVDNAKETEAQNDGDWQSSCGKATERGLHLLRTGTLSDCKFIVGSQVYNTHKLILASASREFEKMLYGETAETRNVFVIKDIRQETFKAMLEYIYTDAINVKNLNDAFSLYCCANKYKLKHLVKICISFLASNLNVNNVCQIYEMAEIFNEHDLKGKCIQNIQIHSTDVFKGLSFLKAKLTTVIKIFSLSMLNYNNEIEIFEAAERYTNAIGNLPNVNTSRKRKLSQDEHIAETSINENINGEENVASTSHNIRGILNTSQDNAVEIDEKMKEVFRKISPYILFLIMTPQQFADKISQSPYLTENEKYGLLINIVSDKTNVPIPEGFSRVRSPRYKLITDPGCHTDESTTKDNNRTEAVFAVKFIKFKMLKQASLPFFFRNIALCVAVDPFINTNIPKQKQLGIHLISPLGKSHITCAAKVEIGVATQKRGNIQRVLKEVDHIFSDKSPTIDCIVPFTDEIFDINTDYVKDNSIVIYVKIKSEAISVTPATTND